ncbi:xylulokinase [Agilicoccus flavus]|uniref:xylulokinase n=1 Tax=Agilicoccus flavus TaxID=2775968 RepID=UPI001CF6A4C1|nr:FGGY family carbohydrate kinase [Agilicoccus flavus]
MRSTDAREWGPAVDAAVRSAVEALGLDAPDAVRRITHVAISHQRETFVCLDEDAEPLGPAILWLDGRAGDQIRRYGTDRVERLCGKPADITPALYKIAWLSEHRPDLMASTRHLVDTHAYLAHRLTGRWVTSTSSADPLALLDIAAGAYSPELLSIAGLSESQLPELHTAGTDLGAISDDVCAAWGLPAGVRLVAGLGDGQAAGLGAAVTTPGQGYLNLGTAVLIGTERQGYQPSRAYRSLWSVTPGQTTLETFLSSGTYLPTWFREQFGRRKLAGAPDPVLEDAAGAVPIGSDGLMTLPYWNSAQTPHWDAQARGAVVGWRGSHTKAHTYRSLLEGVAFELRAQLDGLQEQTGTPIDALHTMGGGSRSALWTRIVADVLDRPLRICAEAEISALGAAMVAHVSAGTHPDVRAAADAMASVSGMVSPDPERVAQYEPLRAIYAELYPTLRETLHRLDSLGTSTPPMTGEA